MAENALKCKWNGGGIPIGYIVDGDKHFQVDALNAPFVVEAFQRYADGETLTMIVRWLNDNGVKNYLGKPVGIDTVNRMLRNRSYIGEYHYDTHIIPGGVPAIVPRDLFARVQERLAKNKKAPARHKAEDDYILTTKLYCGMCGALMLGESGHSSTKRVHHYYKCATAKKRRACKKKTVRKQWIEDIVINETLRMVNDDAILNVIADKVMELQRRDNIVLPVLRKQLAETERGIENILNAIQQGILTQSTKGRLDELELAKSEIEVKILQEEISRPLLTREEILFWLHKFRGIDTSVLEQRQWLVDTFVNAVYLFDDRIQFVYNSKEDSKMVTLADIEQAHSSDITASGVPDTMTTPRTQPNITELIKIWINQIREGDNT